MVTALSTMVRAETRTPTTFSTAFLKASWSAARLTPKRSSVTAASPSASTTSPSEVSPTFRWDLEPAQPDIKTAAGTTAQATNAKIFFMVDSLEFEKQDPARRFFVQRGLLNF